jgi:hypothetical protein
MASLRERWKVSWDDGEPVEVRTTVTDIGNATGLLSPSEVQNNVFVPTALIYCALRRAGHDLPSYEEWRDLIDTYEKLPAAVVIEGPTQEAASLAEQLPLLASQEPTGEPGSTVTTTEPSSLQNSFS